MTHVPTQTPDAQCSAFLDQLDAWLAGDYSAAHMQQHHDSCASCRREAQLARRIGAITSALPQLAAAELHLPASQGKHKAFAAQSSGNLAAQLTQLLHAWLRAWRQPLVFVPAFALLAVVLAVLQSRAPGTAVEPELVIIDGEEYTREEIRKAAEDLQLALRYIDRYRPARVISAELDKGEAPPTATDDSRAQDADAVPTI